MKATLLSTKFGTEFEFTCDDEFENCIQVMGDGKLISICKNKTNVEENIGDIKSRLLFLKNKITYLQQLAKENDFPFEKLKEAINKIKTYDSTIRDSLKENFGSEYSGVDFLIKPNYIKEGSRYVSYQFQFKEVPTIEFKCSDSFKPILHNAIKVVFPHPNLIDSASFMTYKLLNSLIKGSCRFEINNIDDAKIGGYMIHIIYKIMRGEIE